MKKYMEWDKKEDIDHIQYIYRHGINTCSGIFYNIKRYHLLRANKSLGISFSEQKNKVETENKTLDTLRTDAIERIGKDFMLQFKNRELDIDIDAYNTTHNGNIKDECVYLASQWDTLFVTDNIDNRTIHWSLNIRLGLTWSHQYDHNNDKPLFGGVKKYKADIFSSPNTKLQHMHSVLSIFRSNNNTIDLNLYSLQFGQK